jgi:X-Pro dipeptidyl-peptidase
VLVQSGWRDYNVKFSESTRWFESLPRGVPRMLVMDQVDHGTPSDPGFRWEKLLHAWFDRYLYGLDTNVEAQPRVLSKANDGAIRAASAWPPPSASREPLYLRPGGRLSSQASRTFGSIGTYRDSGRTTESDALNTKGSTGELLWFVSRPLERSLRIAGEPRLDLLARTDATSTHFAPVLFDLGPPTTDAPQCSYLSTEEACTMGRGFLNARYRNGLARGEDLVPGRPYRATVPFLGNDWVVKPGHRIGLAVMGTNLWWAVPDQQRATTTLLSRRTVQSRLVLPVVGGTRALRSAGL